MQIEMLGLVVEDFVLCGMLSLVCSLEIWFDIDQVIERVLYGAVSLVLD